MSDVQEKRVTKHRNIDEEHANTAPKHALVDMSTIELKAEDLYDKPRSTSRLVELEDVWTLLQCNEGGLTEEECTRRRAFFGPNKIETEEPNPILQFLSFMWNPLSWVMEGAAIVAIALSNGEGKAPDWPDFVGIVLLLLINSTIGFIEERNAGNAVKALMDSLAPKARAKRDGKWIEIESSDLVPGDVIASRSVTLSPVTAVSSMLSTFSCDQASLTGESLPSTRRSATSASPVPSASRVRLSVSSSRPAPTPSSVVPLP